MRKQGSGSLRLRLSEPPAGENDAAERVRAGRKFFGPGWEFIGFQNVGQDRRVGSLAELPRPIRRHRNLDLIYDVAESREVPISREIATHERRPLRSAFEFWAVAGCTVSVIGAIAALGLFVRINPIPDGRRKFGSAGEAGNPGQKQDPSSPPKRAIDHRHSA